MLQFARVSFRRNRRRAFGAAHCPPQPRAAPGNGSPQPGGPPPARHTALLKPSRKEISTSSQTALQKNITVSSNILMIWIVLGDSFLSSGRLPAGPDRPKSSDFGLLPSGYGVRAWAGGCRACASRRVFHPLLVGVPPGAVAGDGSCAGRVVPPVASSHRLRHPTGFAFRVGRVIRLLGPSHRLRLPRAYDIPSLFGVGLEGGLTAGNARCPRTRSSCRRSLRAGAARRHEPGDGPWFAPPRSRRGADSDRAAPHVAEDRRPI